MPTTPGKQTSPANSQAKRELAARKATDAETENADAAPRPCIPQTIDLIADAVSEMLTTGTNDYCLDKLLVAAIAHTTRRTYERGIGSDDRKVINDAIDREVKFLFPTWKQDLIATWRHNRRQSAAAVESKTITDRIRNNSRDELQDYFERFAGSATPEEVRFLVDVFIDYESSHVGPTFPTAEMGLGIAFDCQLDRSTNTYLKVPQRLGDQVDNYVKALRAVEDKAVA